MGFHSIIIIESMNIYMHARLVSIISCFYGKYYDVMCILGWQSILYEFGMVQK